MFNNYYPTKYSIKKKARDILLFGVISILLSACTTEYNLATKQQETLMYGTEKEVQIGDAVAKQFEAKFEVNSDVDANERVKEIFRKIVDVCDRQELLYSVKVVNDENANALSLPGGGVYIFTGILDIVDNDDQLAGVIAHEVGHIAAKHGMKRLQASYGYTLLQILAASSGSVNAVKGLQTAYLTLLTAYSREDELMADTLGVKYMLKSGYDPKEMVKFLEKLQKEKREAPIKKISIWHTHPYINERIAVVNKEISGKIDFKGYLNLTGNDGI